MKSFLGAIGVVCILFTLATLTYGGCRVTINGQPYEIKLDQGLQP